NRPRDYQGRFAGLRPLVLATALLAGVVMATATGPARAADGPSCGDVITTPGVITLTSDLVCTLPGPPQDPNLPMSPPGTGLVVCSGGVTIDLNGYSISGPNTAFGIVVGCGSNTRIKNGVIRGFAVGVEARPQSAVAFEHVRITGNGTGISGNNRVLITVRGSVISQNGGDGIENFGVVNVRSSVISHNSGGGIIN